jgi:hypothetical protein
MYNSNNNNNSDSMQNGTAAVSNKLINRVAPPALNK